MAIDIDTLAFFYRYTKMFSITEPLDTSDSDLNPSASTCGLWGHTQLFLSSPEGALGLITDR